MNKRNLNLDLPPEGCLMRVIEPLANYICAADQPQAVLMSAMKALLSEVQQTNRLALAHVKLTQRVAR